MVAQVYGPKLVPVVGPPGAPGSDGADGAAGATILAGDGPPDIATGNDGDFYVDQSDAPDSFDFYGPKDGDWPSPPISISSGGGGPGGDVDPATIAALGTVKLTVAPTDPDNPIAVENNDPRNTNARTPTGAAGGVLAGTYPSPSFAADMATQAELDTEAATRASADATEISARSAAVSSEASTRAAADTAETNARIAADALLIPLTQRAANNGVATLGSDGIVPSSQLPPGNMSGITSVDSDTGPTVVLPGFGSDAVAATPALRRIGTTALEAAAGNDSRLSNSRTPTGPAGGNLAGTYPNPTLVAEAVQDLVGPMLRDGTYSGISFTYDDPGGTIGAVVDPPTDLVPWLRAGTWRQMPEKFHRYREGLGNVANRVSHTIIGGDSVTEGYPAPWVPTYRAALARYNDGRVSLGWVNASPAVYQFSTGGLFKLSTGTANSPAGENVGVALGLASYAYKLATGSVLTLQTNATSGSVLSAALRPFCDEIWFAYIAQGTGGGSLEIRIDGTLVQTIVTHDAALGAGNVEWRVYKYRPGIRKQRTVTVTATGSAAIFDGAYFSDEDRVWIWNSAHTGAGTGGWLASPTHIQAIKTINPDLFFEANGINDYSGGLSAYGSNKAAYYDAIRAATERLQGANLGTTANQASMLALSAQPGDYVFRNDGANLGGQRYYELIYAGPTVLANWRDVGFNLTEAGNDHVSYAAVQPYATSGRTDWLDYVNSARFVAAIKGYLMIDMFAVIGSIGVDAPPGVSTDGTHLLGSGAAIMGKNVALALDDTNDDNTFRGPLAYQHLPAFFSSIGAIPGLIVESYGQATFPAIAFNKYGGEIGAPDNVLDGGGVVALNGYAYGDTQTHLVGGLSISTVGDTTATNAASEFSLTLVPPNSTTVWERLTVGAGGAIETGIRNADDTHYLDGLRELTGPASPFTADSDLAVNANPLLVAAPGVAPLVVIKHGATAGTARPVHAAQVLWIGTVLPTNIAVGDIYFNSSSLKYRMNIETMTSSVFSGLDNLAFGTDVPTNRWIQSRGTAAVPAALQSGDKLGEAQYHGTYSAVVGQAHIGARIYPQAMEGYDTSHTGTDYVIELADSAAITTTERARFLAGGGLNLPGAVPSSATHAATKGYVDTTTVVVVNHGATAGTARPATAAKVLWSGTVAPTNRAAGDLYFNTSSLKYSMNIETLTASVFNGLDHTAFSTDAPLTRFIRGTGTSTTPGTVGTTDKLGVIEYHGYWSSSALHIGARTYAIPMETYDVNKGGTDYVIEVYDPASPSPSSPTVRGRFLAGGGLDLPGATVTLSSHAATKAYVDVAVAGGPSDSELIAIAGLTSAANTVPMFTGSGTATLISVTSTAQSLLDDTSVGAMRTTLGAAPTASPTFTGTVTLPTTGAGATEAATKGYVDAAVGAATTDPELLALAGLTSAADTVPMFTGSGTASLITVTSTAVGLLDDTSVGAMRTTLGAAPTASPTFTGTVILPATGAGATEAATKSYVDNADALKAPLASPTFTGTVTVPTPSAGTDAVNKTYSDLKAPLASPTFTGTVTVPTPAAGTSATTKSYVDNADALKAPLASPTFTGTVILPATGAGATEAATKGYVDTAVAGLSDPELAALAGLTSAANQVPIFTGSGTASLFTVTTAAKSVLDDTTVAAMLTTMGGAPLASPTFTGTVTVPSPSGGTDAATKAYVDTAATLDADLVAIAALASAANKVPYSTGAQAWALADFTAFGRSLVDDANGAAGLTTLGVTAAAQTVLDDTTVAAMLATMGGAPLASPTFTGTVTVPTPTNGTDAVTKTYADLKAPLASPTFTGTVTVPTPSGGTDATTKTYVDTADALKANLASPTFTGTVTVPTPAAGTSAVTKTYADGLITSALARAASGTTTGGATSEVFTHNLATKKIVAVTLVNNAAPYDLVDVETIEATTTNTVTVYTTAIIPASYTWQVVAIV